MNDEIATTIKNIQSANRMDKGKIANDGSLVLIAAKKPARKQKKEQGPPKIDVSGNPETQVVHNWINGDVTYTISVCTGRDGKMSVRVSIGPKKIINKYISGNRFYRIPNFGGRDNYSFVFLSDSDECTLLSIYVLNGFVKASISPATVSVTPSLEVPRVPKVSRVSKPSIICDVPDTFAPSEKRITFTKVDEVTEDGHCSIGPVTRFQWCGEIFTMTIDNGVATVDANFGKIIIKPKNTINKWLYSNKNVAAIKSIIDGAVGNEKLLFAMLSAIIWAIFIHAGKASPKSA